MKKEAYEKIIKVIDDYDLKDMYNTRLLCDKHLYHIELKEQYGLDIPFNRIENGSRDFFKIEGFRGDIFVAKFGEKYNRTILNIQEEQPIDETLFCINFPTGAYIFGEDCPSELFDKFFEELKSYKPKYIDEINRYLYFTLENAKDIYNDFNSIKEKYNDLYRSEFNKRKIEELKKEISDLEAKEVENE